MAEGRGAIVLSGHFGNWEIGGVAHAPSDALTTSVVVRPEASAAVAPPDDNKCEPTWRGHDRNAPACRDRSSISGNGCSRTKWSRCCIDRHLGKDQSRSRSLAGRRSFFGRRLSCGAGGGAVGPVLRLHATKRRHGGRCGPLIRVSSAGDADANVARATQNVAAHIEQQLRRHPHYWYQFYPFWTVARRPQRPDVLTHAFIWQWTSFRTPSSAGCSDDSTPNAKLGPGSRRRICHRRARP